MKILRKIIKIDDELCDGCGLCIPSCAEGALKIIDGKAKVVSDKYCDGLGACLGECPQGALKIIEREAEDFDEKAVEEYLAKQPEDNKEEVLACGCSSAQVQIFKSVDSCSCNIEKHGSSLTNWPIKIKLIPANAPFFKDANLLVLADCCGAVFSGLHQELLKDKVLVIGCPKFDDAEAYVEKFKEIFKNWDIKSITIGIMEVPCCSGFTVIVKKGLEKAGKQISIKEIIINPKGEIVS
jgi:NAD-dependent dihydropyrimidine dehydrogenase PreA subunit